SSGTWGRSSLAWMGSPAVRGRTRARSHGGRHGSPRVRAAARAGARRAVMAGLNSSATARAASRCSAPTRRHMPVTDSALAWGSSSDRDNDMGISRKATARWEGDLKSGRGTISTPDSGLMQDTRYGFSSRFGDEKGTNPEELIAAAHAGCFSMALANALAEAGHPADSVDTRAEVDLSMEGGPTL